MRHGLRGGVCVIRLRRWPAGGCDADHRKKQATALRRRYQVRSSSTTSATSAARSTPNGSLVRLGVATRQRSSSRSTEMFSQPDGIGPMRRRCEPESNDSQPSRRSGATDPALLGTVLHTRHSTPWESVKTRIATPRLARKKRGRLSRRGWLRIGAARVRAPRQVADRAV